MLTGKLDIDPARRYTIKETCELLGMCRKTLWKYTKSRDIISEVHSPSGSVFYLGKSIKDFYNKTI